MQGGSHSLRKLRRDWWKTRLCTSCVSPLGRILSRGGICPQCGLRVCKDCRSELEPGTGAWVCVLCSSGGIRGKSRRGPCGERASDNLIKGSKSLGRDSRSIRRSWTISNPQRAQTNSPILKSYTALHPEDAGNPLHSPGSNTSHNNLSINGTPASHHRQFHSLPRMSSETERSKKVKRSFNSEFEKENIKRHRSFQTTLYPYQTGNPPSPSISSINFIEDPFWDYYDYEIDSPSGTPKSVNRVHRLSSARSAGIIMSRRNPSIRSKREFEIRTNSSNRSSCERSVGESVDYDFSLKSMNNFNSLSDTELNDNSKYDSPMSQEQYLLSPRRYSTESSNNFYRFATITPINMSPLNERDNVNKLQNQHIQQHQHLPQKSPVKPERNRGPNKNRRSMSLNSYDGKKLFSPLRTYCLLMKENVVPKTNKISNAQPDATTETNCNFNANGKNTSSVFINPSSSNIPSGAGVSSNLNSTRFHSLPRERVIRIEREDGKFARPGTNNGNNLDERSRNKNNRRTSVVEISRSASTASAVGPPSALKNTTRVPINNNDGGGSSNAKIQRSQSYREISSSKPQGAHEVPSRINVRLEQSSDPYSSQSSGLPLSSREGKEPYQRPYFDSILDDRNSVSVMENFLRSQNQKAKSRESRNNEKASPVPSKDSPNKSDYIQSHMNDFETFQRQQIQTFDSYLRQCSSLPRASGKGAWPIQTQQSHPNPVQKPMGTNRLGSEPKHVSKTTISDDNLRKFDDLDAYFHPSNNNHNDESSVDNHERILPIVVVNGGSAGWSATLPHPYVRRHKQQKTSFLEQAVPSGTDTADKIPSPISINEIEQEIENDIYFQKTKSLDRHRPSKQKPEATQSTNGPVPVPSPRFKRKAKLASNVDLSSSPKINTEQSHPQEEYVSELGTNYQKNQVHQVSSSSYPNKNSRLPIEPVQTSSDHFKQHPIRTAVISNTPALSAISGLKNMPVPILPTSSHESLSKIHKDFILESQSNKQSSYPSTLSPSDSKMKSATNSNVTASNSTHNHKSVSSTGPDLMVVDADSELKLSSRSSPSALSLNQNKNPQKNEDQQVEGSAEPPIATPRARRKNSNQQRYNSEQDSHEAGDGGHNNNHNSNNQSQAQQRQSLDPVQFGGGGDMSKSQSNLPKAVRFEPHVIEMEMENERKHNQAKAAANNNFNVNMRMNNQVQAHLARSPLSSSHYQNNANNNTGGTRNRGSVHQYSSGSALGLGNSKKNHVYQYHYHGGVKSSKADSEAKKKKSQAYGFVARAIAKVKAKSSKTKSISGGGIKTHRPSSPSGSGSTATPITTDINTSSGIQSVETRDSITYISPPPTQQQGSAEITQPLSHNSQSSTTVNAISRAESFNKSVIKHEADERNNKHSIVQEITHPKPAQAKSSPDYSITNKVDQELSPQGLKGILTSPVKPKRSPNIMDPLSSKEIALGKSSLFQSDLKTDSLELDPNRNNDQFHGLISDQLTPSSSSESSSSSYLSNLQESYDFFHDSECESIPADESDGDDDGPAVFKSFDEDEDAGSDFIFYSNQAEEEEADVETDEERRRRSHAYNGPANPIKNSSSSSFNNAAKGTIPIPKKPGRDRVRKTFPGGDYYHKTGEDKTKKEASANNTVEELPPPPLPASKRKGLDQEQVEDNGMDEISYRDQHLLKHPQQQALKKTTYRVQHSHSASPSTLQNNYNSEQVGPRGRCSDLSQSDPRRSEHVGVEEHDEKLIAQQDQQTSRSNNNNTTTTGISYQPVVVGAEKVPRAKTFAYKNRQKDNNNRIEDRECFVSEFSDLQQSQLLHNKSTKSAQYGTVDSGPLSLGSSRPSVTQDGALINPKFKFPKANNLLLPSSFIKSNSLPRKKQNSYQDFNQSEFFPGDSTSGGGGMSLLGDEGSSGPSQNQGRFKSRVLVNRSEEEPQLTPVQGALTKGAKFAPGSGKRNVTRVDLSSGDVGVVSTNTTAENAFLKDRRAQLKKTNENKLWNDVYTSGLTQLSKQTVTNGANDEDYDDGDNERTAAAVEECSSTTSLDNNVGSFDETGSNVSQNGSSGSGSTISDEKIGSSSDNVTLTGSDDGSSDWHSESTKNTVIFRGDLSNPSKQWPPGEGDSEGGVFNYNCDPEIHISSITLVDNVTGNGVTSSPSSQTTNSSPMLAKTKANNDVRETINKSSDDKERDNRENVKSLSDKAESISSSFTSQDVSRTLPKTELADSSEELGKSNETLTDEQEDVSSPIVQMPEDPDEIEMVQPVPEGRKSGHPNVPSNNKTSAFHQRRESPEGQEQDIPSPHPDKDPLVSTNRNKASKKVLGVNEVIIMEDKGSSGQGKISKSKISQNALSQIISASNRSSPDGADAERSEGDTTEPDNDSPTPMIEHFDVTSDDDSWAEEISFEEEYSSMNAPRKQQPPPLDLTLHTIVEESCEESEAETSGNFQQQPSTSQRRRQQNDNELEKYFNFGIQAETGSQGGRNSLTNEESEFSDTFSESSFSLQDDELGSGSLKPDGKGFVDPAELASSRLEKYFFNLGLPQSMINPISSINQTADSDSVGSESESDNSVLEKRKKVLRHHRRSADFEDEFGDKVSDEDDFGFGQDGFDTIKKTGRKVKKSGSENNLLECATGANSKSSDNLLGGVTTSDSVEPSSVSQKDKDPLEMSLSAGGTSLSSKEGSSSTSPTSPSASRKSKTGEKAVIKVNRSNSFTWSSDEEVNIMMSKFRQLIKNLLKSKIDSNAAVEATSGTTIAQSSSTTGNAKDKDKQLAYLENELIRLMKSENLKNMVECLSSEDSDVDDMYKFIRVVKESGNISNPEDSSDLDLCELDLEDPNLFQTLQTTMQAGNASSISPGGSPAMLAKVMHHIGNRLAVWMKDENVQEDDHNDDSVTLKCAQSVSSDLNEDRFSWKGSFESALAAKRQSVGSTDSISSSDFTQDRSILRSSSLHHLANSSHHLGQVEEHKEEEESASSLPRMTNLCNSLPRLNQPSNLPISRAHSLVMPGRSEGEPVGPIKSARYRPPGFQPVKSKRMDDDGTNSPILSQSTPVLTQDPGNLKIRSDSMGSIFHDTKPHISVKGQVEFGLQYNYKLACLEVRVKQCRDLAAVDNKRNRSDPYVKAYLLPDRSKNGKRKTKTKKNTLSPVFDEVLKFPLTLSDLQNRTLWLSVWHSDIFGKNEFLGEVLVDLKDRVFDETNPQSWDLQEMSGQMEDVPRGDVIIALKWQPKTENTGNLSVLVKEAKNVTSVKTATPSTFVKCTLLTDKSRKQKSSICRRSSNPVWNQTMNFEDVDDDGIEITLWNHDLLSNHDLLGTVRIDYDSPLWESMLSRHSFWVEGGLRLN